MQMTPINSQEISHKNQYLKVPFGDITQNELNWDTAYNKMVQIAKKYLKKRGKNLRQEIGASMRSIKLVGKELNCNIMEMCHIENNPKNIYLQHYRIYKKLHIENIVRIFEQFKKLGQEMTGQNSKEDFIKNYQAALGKVLNNLDIIINRLNEMLMCGNEAVCINRMQETIDIVNGIRTRLERIQGRDADA